MKDFNSYKQIEKPLSAEADLRLKNLLKAQYEAQTSATLSGKNWFGRVATLAVMSVVVIGVLFDPVTNWQANQVLAKAETVFETRQAQLGKTIHHQKWTISEGTDKADFVANTLGTPLAAAQSVPLRTDTVEYWHHSNTRLAVVDSSLPSSEQGKYLVLENEDHIHIFHDPESLQKDRAVPLARQQFDTVHDLDTHYAMYTDFTDIPNEALPTNLTFVTKTSDTFTFRQSGEGTHTDFVFDQSGNLLNQDIYVYQADRAYHMATIEFQDENFFPETQFAEIFDPSQNNFTQTDVFPLL